MIGKYYTEEDARSCIQNHLMTRTYHKENKETAAMLVSDAEVDSWSEEEPAEGEEAEMSPPLVKAGQKRKHEESWTSRGSSASGALSAAEMAVVVATSVKAVMEVQAGGSRPSSSALQPFSTQSTSAIAAIRRAAATTR